MESVRDFYDHLAADYHLIYPDWRSAVVRQGAVLDRLVRSILGEGERDVLDCACGIGTQAIGLALRGHRVVATDISEASLERARAEAATFGVTPALRRADMRDLTEVDGDFDVVVALDDSLPHLLEDEELSAAAGAIAKKLRPGGLFVASTRDYDRAVLERPAATAPRVFGGGGEPRRIVFQAWEWERDANTYALRLFILRESGEEWAVSTHATRYRALLRAELEEVLARTGLRTVRWHDPAKTGFFQPIVTARAPE